MKKDDKFRVMMKEDFDEESNTLVVVSKLLSHLTFDQQWRILNYVLVRLWGRSWVLARPARDTKESA